MIGYEKAPYFWYAAVAFTVIPAFSFAACTKCDCIFLTRLATEAGWAEGVRYTRNDTARIDVWNSGGVATCWQGEYVTENGLGTFDAQSADVDSNCTGLDGLEQTAWRDRSPYGTASSSTVQVCKNVGTDEGGV